MHQEDRPACRQLVTTSLVTTPADVVDSSVAQTIAPGSHADEQYGNHKECANQEYVNQKEFRVIGMSRSGNHAIINWILNQTRGRVCHLNCAEGKSNPFLSARPLHNGLPFQTNYAEFDLAQEQAGIFTQKELLIHSYEDCFLGYVCHPIFEQNHDQWVGRSHARTDILILRDPYNLFASRQRAGETLGGVSAAVAPRIWQQHAREYLGKTRHLQQPSILINYNRWVGDLAYREQIAARLGLEFTDAGIDEVPRTGGGSSFDGDRFHGAASKMPVLERWKSYQHDVDYRQIFKPTLAEYARRVFDPLPGVEAILQDRAAAD